MYGVAEISYRNAAVILPAQTPYDLEVVLEYADWSARRGDEVRLRSGGHEWQVTKADRDDPRVCIHCGRSLASRACIKSLTDTSTLLCSKCVRYDIAAVFADVSAEIPSKIRAA
jgi:hypothetical protein